jgi:hypothetical protein
MSVTANLDVASHWMLDNDTYLAAEMSRLRLILHRRSLWLRKQWSHDAVQDYMAWKISEAHADWLLREEDRTAEADFYQTDPAAALIGRPLAALEQQIAERRQAMREAGAPAGLDLLAQLFDLTAFERDTLLLVVAAELDPSLERLYAYLQDDLTRRYATPHLAMALFLPPEHSPQTAYQSLLPDGALRRFRLLVVEEQPGPFAGRALRIDERVLDFVLGRNRLDEKLRPILDPPPEALTSSSDRELARQIVSWIQAVPHLASFRTVNLLGASNAVRANLARGACDELRLNLYELNTACVPVAPAERRETLACIEREAVLLQAALYVDLDLEHADEAQRLARELDQLRAFLFVGSSSRWPGEKETLVLRVSKPDAREQGELWEQALARAGMTPNAQISALVEQFDFTAPVICRAVASASASTLRENGSAHLREHDLWRACEEQAAPKLNELAQRIAPCFEWSDIVLPREAFGQLQEIADQIKNRAQVYGEWGFGARLNRGRGISALFAGPSGTGKTMAAEVLARHLNLDLYRIDLAGVVSKYIGETEKNLRSVFDAAERGGAILFFDEADALFGKRSEVKDSHDRYANIEVNYLLQRMEEYRGLAILATNRKSAMDSAFLRRLRFVVDFPFPDAAHRERIWQAVFPKEATVEGLDFTALARLELAGAHIRNIALGAAFLAASEGASIGMPHIMRAARREYLKMERVVQESEFGRYYEAVTR